VKVSGEFFQLLHLERQVGIWNAPFAAASSADGEQILEYQRVCNGLNWLRHKGPIEDFVPAWTETIR
jgi:hypothetical protein